MRLYLSPNAKLQPRIPLPTQLQSRQDLSPPNERYGSCVLAMIILLFHFNTKEAVMCKYYDLMTKGLTLRMLQD